MIIKTEKSHDLPFAKWSLQKPVVQFKGLRARGWQCRFQLKSEGLRTRSTTGRRSIFSPTECIQPSLPFCSIQALNRLKDDHPHWGRPPALLSQPIQTHPEIMFNQMSGHPMVKSNWHIKLIMILYWDLRRRSQPWNIVKKEHPWQREQAPRPWGYYKVGIF